MGYLTQLGIKAFKRGLFYKTNLFNSYARDSLRPVQAVILTYHSVNPSQAPNLYYINSSLCITQDAFKRQIEFLIRHYDVMSLDHVLMYVQSNYQSTRMPAAVTFDDGYRDNYLYAFPILRDHNVPALFYLTTDCIDGRSYLWTAELRYVLLKTIKTRLQLKMLNEGYSVKSKDEKSLALQAIKKRMLVMPREMREETMAELRCEADVKDMTPLDNTMLTWHEVKEMHRMGMSFGAHTLSHPSLPHIPLEEARREILESKQALEAQMDHPITHFSYPNPGDQLNFNEELKAILHGGGYNSATTSESGYVKPSDDFFQLKRKGIYTTFSDLPDFHCWIERENIINRWNNLPILGNLGFKLLSRSE